MAVLVTAIHAFFAASQTWMAGDVAESETAPKDLPYPANFSSKKLRIADQERRSAVLS